MKKQIENILTEYNFDRLSFDEASEQLLNLLSVGSSVMPEWYRVYTCTNCQRINVKRDNRKVRVGFCDNCDHPLWNSAEDVPHD